VNWNKCIDLLTTQIRELFALRTKLRNLPYFEGVVIVCTKGPLMSDAGFWSHFHQSYHTRFLDSRITHHIALMLTSTHLVPFTINFRHRQSRVRGVRIASSGYRRFRRTFTYLLGRAIAQAVSRWLPTTAARVRSRVWSSGICGGQSGAGADFACKSSFHQLLHNHPHLSSGASTIGQKWLQCNKKILTY
jgi:hypothetical protein